MQRTKEFYKKQYLDEYKSIRQIAEEQGTYINEIRRELINFGFRIRSKSETQSIALRSGRATNPSKGKPRSDEVKKKISETLKKKETENGPTTQDSNG
jgi:hypothetical protein